MIAMQDVLPTLMALSGDEPGRDQVDGRSVWPILTGQATLPPNPVVTVSGPGAPSYAVIVYPWKLVQAPNGEVSLFNVEADPTESYEFSLDYPNITRQLTEYLEGFPKGTSVHLPYQEIANDTDFFGGEEDREPWAEAVITDR